MSATSDKQVVVHPTVLLSVVDHYNRVARGTHKRVVGTLLGENQYDGKLHITSSFAVPFEEDLKDPDVYFFDHVFHESMAHMFKKVNTKEHVVGWYSTGPLIRRNDLAIHEIYRTSMPTVEPYFCIIDIRSDQHELPIKAYTSIPEYKDSSLRAFAHVPSAVGASEPEEIGVDHLLRDVSNRATTELADTIGEKLNGLKMLVEKLDDIADYLGQVAEGKLKMNLEVVYNMQEFINYMGGTLSPEMAESFSKYNTDTMLLLYLSSICRSIMGMHDLAANIYGNPALQA